MKKISIISLVTLSILVSAFALPAQGQFGASRDCTLSDAIAIDIDVPGSDPAVDTDNDIREIYSGSVVASTAAGMNGTQAAGTIRVITVDETGTDVELGADALGVAASGGDMDAAQISAVADEWGTICLVNTINNIVNWLFFILLTVAFFLIVVAAFIWVTSAGDATKQQTARNIIIAAMVGIVIAIFARLIPAVVLGIVT